MVEDALLYSQRMGRGRNKPVFLWGEREELNDNESERKGLDHLRPLFPHRRGGGSAILEDGLGSPKGKGGKDLLSFPL